MSETATRMWWRFTPIARVLLVLVVLMAIYIVLRIRSAPVDADATPADTMCVASKLGLPCSS